MSNNKNYNRQTIFGFLIGAALGGGIAYLTFSKKGKKIRANAATKMGEWNDKAKTKINDGVDVAKDKLSNALHASKDYVDNVSSNFTEKVGAIADNLHTTIDNAQEEINEGTKVAKKKLKAEANGSKS